MYHDGIFYAGTPEQWQNITKAADINSTVYYNVTQPYVSVVDNTLVKYLCEPPEDFVIPEVINGQEIKAIGSYIFGNMDSTGTSVSFTYPNTKRVVIPKTVERIDENAFAGLSGLSEYSVDAENVNFSAEDGLLYNKDKTVLISVPYGLDSVKLPYGIKTLKSYAISMCENLKAIVIPNTVTNIEGSAIYCCGSLESITLSSGLRSIENYIIRECKSLQSLTVPEGVETINGSPAANCSAFKYMILPVSLKDAGGNLGYVPYFAFKVKYMGTSEQWEAIINAPQCAEISFSASAVPVSVRETTAGTEVCVTPQNMEHGAKLMLAFYDGEKLVQCSTVSYTGQSVTSVCSKQFDRVKAMAVSADGSFKPLSDFGEIRYK